MNNERRESVVRGQRVPTRHVLKIKRKSVCNPRARLDRPAIELLGQQCSIRTTDVNLDDLRIRRVPTDGGLP